MTDLTLVLPPSTKKYNYGNRASQGSSCLTNFTINSISIYVSIFFVKIDSMTNLMVLILYRECQLFFIQIQLKLKLFRLLKKRESHSFVDGVSIIRSTEGRDDRSNIGQATDDRGGRGQGMSDHQDEEHNKICSMGLKRKYELIHLDHESVIG